MVLLVHAVTKLCIACITIRNIYLMMIAGIIDSNDSSGNNHFATALSHVFEDEVL